MPKPKLQDLIEKLHKAIIDEEAATAYRKSLEEVISQHTNANLLAKANIPDEQLPVDVRLNVEGLIWLAFNNPEAIATLEIVGEGCE